MTSFLSALCLAFLLFVPVSFASEVTPPEDFTSDSTFSESFDGEKVQSNVTTNVFVQLPDTVLSAPDSDSVSDSDPSASDLLLSPVIFTSAIAQSIPAAPSTFKGFMQGILGDYQPLSVVQTGSDGSTTVVVPDGVSGLDWPWIAGAVAFLLSLYSLFRLLGVLLK